MRVTVQRYEQKKVVESIRAIMGKTKLLSMATYSRHEGPHINNAFYAFDDEAIYFLSDRETRHCKNIESSRALSIGIADSSQRWGNELRGLQMWGGAVRVYIDEREKAIRCYARRFPAFRNYIKDDLGSDYRRLEGDFYAFTPNRFCLFDEKVFGEETYIHGRIQLG
jgi:uncharacterized protein YhbP (UPF0306 family)